MKVPYVRSVSDNWKCNCCGSEEFIVVRFQPLIVICDLCGEMQDEDDFIEDMVEERKIKKYVKTI